MKVVLLAPYGSLHPESGLMYLLAHSVRGVGVSVSQLLCNGAFSLCDRDGETGWSRGVRACLTCAGEQRALANWSGAEPIEISRYITVDDVRESKEWISSVATSRLLSLRYEDVPLFDLCAGSFRARFGVELPDLDAAEHEPVLRRLMLAAVRMCMAARRFDSDRDADLVLVAGGNDVITKTYLRQAAGTSRPVSVFAWDMSGRMMTVTHPHHRETYSCTVFVQGGSTMRTDLATWPSEIRATVEGLINFLGLRGTQLSLPFVLGRAAGD